MIQRNIKTSLPKQSNKLLIENKRKLQTATNDNRPVSNDEWDNIRIAYNTDGLLDQWTDYDFKHWFARDVIPAAIEFLEKGNYKSIHFHLLSFSYPGTQTNAKSVVYPNLQFFFRFLFCCLSGIGTSN